MKLIGNIIREISGTEIIILHEDRQGTGYFCRKSQRHQRRSRWFRDMIASDLNQSSKMESRKLMRSQAYGVMIQTWHTSLSGVSVGALSPVWEMRRWKKIGYFYSRTVTPICIQILHFFLNIFCGVKKGQKRKKVMDARYLHGNGNNISLVMNWAPRWRPRPRPRPTVRQWHHESVKVSCVVAWIHAEIEK